MKPLSDNSINEVDDTATQVTEKEIKIETKDKIKSLNNIQEIEDFIEIVSDSSTIKSIKPRNFYDQLKIENDGTNGKLWVYVMGLTNTSSNNWKKITLS